LVGDPGSGKSAMLTFISKVAPKARLVSGKGATGAGLTATVVKDEFLRGWALEAGALVLTNGGIAVIDELDKMSSEDRDALHEALEQQRISISKANIQATLKAETTVLAAANPKLGRFDPYAPIASQIDLPPTLINRFDLIFPIRDLPSKEMDEKIAGHVLNLQQNPEDIRTEISSSLFKKYLSYSRQKIVPRLTNEAIQEIKNFYVDLRNTTQKGEGEIKPIPISARQLEALVRLAEASAKIRLSENVAKEDAIRAIELLRHCLMQVGFDYETGQIDIDKIATGVPTSQRSRIVTIREIVKKLENKVGKMIPITDIIAEATEQNVNEAQVEEIIEQLKREAEIFEPRRGFVSRL
jgi:replicative DNA helicase Mcm